MKTIKIGFSSPNTFKIGAWAIQKWIGKDYSHVYINWIDDQGRDIVFQASHGCCHTILKDNFELENIIHKEFIMNITEDQYQALRDFCYNYCGVPYAFLDLPLIVIYDVLSKLGIKTLFYDVPGEVCSELVAILLKEIFGFTFDKPSNLMKPNDIYESLEKNL